MAELSTLARPYARAAFEHALEKGELSAWASQLATLAAVSADNKFQHVLTNPGLTAEQQAATVCEVCGDALSTEMRNFVSIIAHNKRLILLAEISALFAHYKTEQEKSVDVEVISAFAIPEATSSKLAHALGDKLEREVKVRTTVDAGLLGGVLIRAGDTVIDGSVRGRLNKLAEAMNS